LSKQSETLNQQIVKLLEENKLLEEEINFTVVISGLDELIMEEKPESLLENTRKLKKRN
jgi:hypothetical protein